MLHMNTTQNEFGKALRKCGCCDKHVATKLALDGMETFVVHLDRGYLCPGSGNISVAGREFLASVVAKEVR